MWSFRNKDKQLKTGVPVPNQQNTWVVWLLSIATFVITVLIVLGLFWVGGWAVRHFTKKPAPAPTKTTTTSEESAKTGNNQGSTNSTGNSSGSTGNSSASQNSTPTATTPAANPSASTLVNTGPTSDE